ncbi:hypothetical protein HFP72_35320, partial [Nocardiopsis sp. ARC36]
MGEEPRTAYDRVALSSYFDGASAQDLSLGDLSGPHVDVHVGERATPWTATPAPSPPPPAAPWATTGSSWPPAPPLRAPRPRPRPARLPLYRTIEDLDAITASAATPAPAWSSAADCSAWRPPTPCGCWAWPRRRTRPHLMPAQIDEGAGPAPQTRHRPGRAHHTGAASTAVEAGADGRVRNLLLGDGTRLDADLVVFSWASAPRRPRTRRRLRVGERGDRHRRHLHHSDDRIHAIGEAAAHRGTVYGLIPGNAMAEVVADRLLGGGATFTGADTSTKLKLLGVDVASFGDATAAPTTAWTWSSTTPPAAATPNSSVRRRHHPPGRHPGRRRLRLRHPAPHGRLAPARRPAHPHTPEGGAALGADALPDSAQICSCNAVTKGALTDAIHTRAPATSPASRRAHGRHQLRVVRAHAQADPLPGGHRAVQGPVRALHPVPRRTPGGPSAPPAPPPSPPSSRTTGRQGCDICKPAVASILASRGAGTSRRRTGHTPGHQRPLPRQHAAQRHYSVVPASRRRDHPDKLIVIGEVARDFQLYTKITGGQRIDLFGARLEQLPAIWPAWSRPGSSPATPTASPCAPSSRAWAPPGAATASRTRWAWPSAWRSA